MTDSNRTRVVGDQVITTPEVRYSVVDLSAEGPTVVHAGPALLRGVNINVLPSDAVAFMDGDIPVDSIPASTLAGAWIPYGDAYYPNGIYADHSGTGEISVKFIPLA